jgi:aminoglycoside phosphotransferase (APT) family kinase protein
MSITIDHGLRCETIAKALRTIAPDWTLRESDPLAGGYHHVHRLVVDTPAGERECVLKATPDDERSDGVEPRLLSVLAERTSLPVPGVLGVVDDHGTVPSPYFVMDAAAGRVVDRTEADRLSTPTLGTISRSVGRHLAELHRLDAVNEFGHVTHRTGPLDGNRPPGTIDSIGVADPTPSWPPLVREWTDDWLDRLAESRFADLVPEVRPVVDRKCNDLTEAGPFDSAICHIDCSLDNLAFDLEDGSVTGLLDWEFTLAAPPAYDLAFVEGSLAGGPWWYVPDASDRRTAIRDALHEGYRDGGSGEVPRKGRDLYELATCLSSMTLFEDWLVSIGATDEQIEGAARRHHQRIRTLL